MKQPDLALSALLESAKVQAGVLTEDLIKKAYEIHVSHQFDEDREASMRAIGNLVEDFVNSQKKGA